MLHTDLCRIIKPFVCGDGIIDGGVCVLIIAGRHDNNIPGLADRAIASFPRNVDTNCVHEAIPLNDIATVKTKFLIAYSICWDSHEHSFQPA